MVQGSAPFHMGGDQKTYRRRAALSASRKAAARTRAMLIKTIAVVTCATVRE